MRAQQSAGAAQLARTRLQTLLVVWQQVPQAEKKALFDYMTGLVDSAPVRLLLCAILAFLIVCVSRADVGHKCSGTVIDRVDGSGGRRG